MTTIDAALVSAPTYSRLTADTRYVLSGFPTGLAATIVCATGLSLGLGLAVLWIGVPILIATMMLARGFAVTERTRIAVAPFVYRAAASDTVISRLIAVVTDPQSWRDLAHAMLRCVPSAIAFSVVVSWWAAVAGGMTWALWGWSLPQDGKEVPELLGFGDDYWRIVGFYLVVAAVFALTLPAVAGWAARFEAGFAQRLLSPGARGN
ncbi:hypothetical protein FB565_000419 [Actinoplanes lutulentus]|uniref:Putative sensor protein n=1 Tax=Actinoplanes lutulentus TaxID=1287878 RepID=A0A327ZLS6_9ACTN|nr:sensor domain-containing protein [Actinoplanes lutulentus]MBB2940715.1 hypothetical protein [Actinoplanes lutulentus]RAK43026.1 putative sensor protein [Actinoplanes lutulentus]